jgi:hypothetical protein
MVFRPPGAVGDLINFKKEVSGFTVFIALP